MPERITQIGDALFIVLDEGCLLTRPLADSAWRWLFEDVDGVNAVAGM